MHPKPGVLYGILREWARQKKPRTYGDLSAAYRDRTGVWLEPHGTWDGPLGSLNNRVVAFDAPAISALVVLQGTGEPGGGFWGCAPSVPARPRDELARKVAWGRIVEAVCAYPWPAELPR